MFNLDNRSVNYITDSFTSEEINALCMRNYYISGGTGFVGKWIISTINALAGKNPAPEIKVITRNPVIARKSFMKHSHISVLDWRELNTHLYSNAGDRRIVGFHSSVPAASGGNIKQNDINAFRETTETYANFLSCTYKNPVFINLSSGTVYERPISGLISESQFTKKKIRFSPYDLVKIADEEVVKRLTLSGEIEGANPRLFSFTGPGLEIPGTYALTSFMHDAVLKKAVRITGCPNSLRSYMSPIDMGIWILKSSLYPTTEVIHVGSSEALSMYEIATIVSRKFGNGKIKVSGATELNPAAYVPETTISASILNIYKVMDFERSLEIWEDEFTHS